jgi:hypothetical protein
MSAIPLTKRADMRAPEMTRIQKLELTFAETRQLNGVMSLSFMRIVNEGA